MARHAEAIEDALRRIAAPAQNARHGANLAVPVNAPRADPEAALPNAILNAAAAVRPQLAPEVVNPVPGAAALPQNAAAPGRLDGRLDRIAHPGIPLVVPPLPHLPFAQLAQPELGPLDMYGNPVDITEMKQRLTRQERYNHRYHEDLLHREYILHQWEQHLQREEVDARMQQVNRPVVAANLNQLQRLPGQPAINRNQPQPAQGAAPRQQGVAFYSVEEHQRLIREAVEKERQAGKLLAQVARAESYQRGRADTYKEILDRGRGGAQRDGGEVGVVVKEEA